MDIVAADLDLIDELKPLGCRTTLGVDVASNLTRVSAVGGDFASFRYALDGLLPTLTSSGISLDAAA